MKINYMYFYMKIGDVLNCFCILFFCLNIFMYWKWFDMQQLLIMILNNLYLYIVKFKSMFDFNLDFDLCLMEFGS